MTSQPAPRAKRRIPRAAWIAVAVVALIIAAVAAWQLRPKEEKDPYRLAAVQQGDVTRSVSASGALQALVTVDVGSQISGQIRQVMVDFNDPVRRGQVLAVLDPQTFQSRVAQGEADIQAGTASIRQAEATVANAQADYNRKKELVDKGIYAPSVLDQSTATYRSAQAAVTAARARVAQSRAALRVQQVDLGRTTIISPIDGIVIDRKVEPGNTVAASLSAPVLFTIAQDLSKVEVRISVDEADVGQVQPGQTVRFTVDAFPDDNFEGIVTQVRKQPATEQNVVTYTVIAEADNPQGRLLPGMTANADIIIATIRNVIKAPAAALRWSPPSENARTTVGGPPGMGGGPPGLGGGRPGGGGGQGGGQGSGPGGGQRGGALGARLVEQLDLDAGQKKRWEAIQAEMRQASAAAMSASGGDRRAMREAMRKNLEGALAKLEPTLKPEQKTKLVALRATMAQGRGAQAGLPGGVVYVLKDGKPSPVAVRVGATDGSSTQVVGPLQPGQQVIIGGGPKPKAQVRSPFGGGGGQRGRP